MKRALLSALTLFAVLPTEASADTGMGGFDIMSLLPIVLIFVVFYFLLLRPQQKKMKAHQELLGNLYRGDKVVTSGGIIGIVQKTTDTEVVLEIADNVKVNIVKSMITEVVSSTAKSVAMGDNVTALPKAANKAAANKAAVNKSKDSESKKPSTPKKTK